MCRMIRFTLSLCLVGLLGGCASVFNDKAQVVSVRAVCLDRSVPANCVAENSRGRWAFRAPNDILVTKDMYALRVTCKSLLVEQHTVQAPAVLQNAVAGNLLAGGVVGAAIDVGTGRGFAYPSNIDVAYPSCNVY